MEVDVEGVVEVGVGMGVGVGGGGGVWVDGGVGVKMEVLGSHGSRECI